MQEAYRPPRSKCLLCCSVFRQGGMPIQCRRGEGYPSSPNGGSTPSSHNQGVPPIGWIGYPHQLDGGGGCCSARKDGETPCQEGWGIPSPSGRMGVPPLGRMGHPQSEKMGVCPPSRKMEVPLPP